jgi:hypothetical protein
MTLRLRNPQLQRRQQVIRLVGRQLFSTGKKIVDVAAVDLTLDGKGNGVGRQPLPDDFGIDCFADVGFHSFPRSKNGAPKLAANEVAIVGENGLRASPPKEETSLRILWLDLTLAMIATGLCIQFKAHHSLRIQLLAASLAPAFFLSNHGLVCLCCLDCRISETPVAINELVPRPRRAAFDIDGVCNPADLSNDKLVAAVPAMLGVSDNQSIADHQVSGLQINDWLCHLFSISYIGMVSTDSGYCKGEIPTIFIAGLEAA